MRPIDVPTHAAQRRRHLPRHPRRRQPPHRARRSDREPFEGAFTIVGDEGRLGQVLTNLIDNAISFSPEGGTVTVRARAEPRFVEILVEDEGPGIPEDRLEIIFDRFYSDRPETDASRGKNSGLGLSISREIVRAHGGEIIAENRYADGAAARHAARRRPLHRAAPHCGPDAARRGAGWTTQLRTIHGTAIALGEPRGPHPRRAGIGKIGPRAQRCLAVAPTALIPSPGDARRRRSRAISRADGHAHGRGACDDPRQARGARAWNCDSSVHCERPSWCWSPS